MVQRFGILADAVTAVALSATCGPASNRDSASTKGMACLSIAVTSTACAPNSEIPSMYACEGSDTSVPIAWSGAPANTTSFALIVDDPDAPHPQAPTMTDVH